MCIVYDFLRGIFRKSAEIQLDRLVLNDFRRKSQILIVNPRYFYLNANRCLCMFENREEFQCEGQECRIQRENPIAALCLFILTSVCICHPLIRFNNTLKSHRHKQTPATSISSNDDVILTDNAVKSVFIFAVWCDKLQKSMQYTKRIRTTPTAVALRRKVKKKQIDTFYL